MTSCSLPLESSNSVRVPRMANFRASEKFENIRTPRRAFAPVSPVIERGCTRLCYVKVKDGSCRIDIHCLENLAQTKGR